MSLEESLPFIVKAIEAAWWVILTIGGGAFALLLYIWKQRSKQTEELIRVTTDMGKEMHTMSDNVEGLNGTVTKQWSMISKHETALAVINEKLRQNRSS